MNLKKISNNALCADFSDSGDIISLSCETVKNLLAQKGLCVWLKRGTMTDPATGVFSNFMDSFHEAGYQIIQTEPTVIIFSREAAGLRLTKKFELIDKKLKLSVQVTNRSDRKIDSLQLEFHNLFATPPIAEREMDYSLMYPDRQSSPAKIIRAECFGQRFVEALPCTAARHRCGRQNRDFHIRLDFTGSCEAMTAMIMGRVFMRGFNSLKFAIKPGESYYSGMELVLESGSIDKFIPKPKKPRASASPARVLELFNGTAVFKRRWSHLCLQYDQVNPDILRRIIGDLLAPLHYTGIILELNRGVVTHSHPELAAEWAMPISELKSIAEFIRSHGLEVGFEFNTPGHQNETGIAELMPELLEPNPSGHKKAALCVSHPRVREIIGEIFNELTDAIEPDLINLGADEVQFEGYGKAFGNCPLCRNQEPYRLFGEYIQWLYSQVKRTECAMFGDMFIQSEQFGAACSGNGSAGEVWRALDLIPPKIAILDWHYYPAESYGSLELFRNKGFKVWPVTAFNIVAMRNFLAHAERLELDTALHTTWSVPSQEKFAVESAVWAGIYHWLGTSAPTCEEIEAMTKEFCRNFWQNSKLNS